MDDETVVGMICGVMGLLVLGLLTFIGVVTVDGVQEWRSFDARVACENVRMKPQRRPLTTDVTCVPISTRQDTTTVNLNR